MREHCPNRREGTRSAPLRRGRPMALLFYMPARGPHSAACADYDIRRYRQQGRRSLWSINDML